MNATLLKLARKKNGWSVADLAKRCGVSPRTVEGWEQGRPVNLPAMMALMHAIKKEAQDAIRKEPRKAPKARKKESP